MGHGVDRTQFVRVSLFVCMFKWLYLCVHVHVHVNVNEELNYGHHFCVILVVDCFNLTSPTNGQVSLDMTTFGAVANYSCNDGYILMGPNVRNCQSNGSWSEDIPVCQSKLLPTCSLGNGLNFNLFCFALFASCGLFEPHCSEQWSGVLDHNHLRISGHLHL